MSLAGVSILRVLTNDDVVNLAGLPNLFYFAVDLVLDSRVQLDRTHIRIEIELLPITDDLREPRELRFGIRLAGFRENSLAVNFMPDRAEQDRVGCFAFFKRACGPFQL